MNPKHLLLLGALTAAFSACKPDDDEYATPTSSPCTISCQNGGTVTSSCECDCPNGFYGTNCQNQQTPTKFRVSSLKLTNWPVEKSNGDPWDLGIGTAVRPDIRVEWNVGTSDYVHTGYYSNCDINQDYTYNQSEWFPFYLYMGTTYDFRFYDDDGATDDLMLNSSMNVGNHDNGLPSTLYLTSGGFQFQVTGQWYF